MNMLNKIIDTYYDEEFLKADGFDDAVVGVSSNMILIYSIDKCIEILMLDHKMDYADALEFFYFNVEGSFVGDKTPIFIYDKL